MNSLEMLATYETLHELSDSMLHAANEGDWDELACLEKCCQNYVSKLMLAAPVELAPQEQRTKVTLIRDILQNDARIRALTEPRLEELQQRLHMIRNGQRGLQAYGEQRP
jgi:flagellar protein FliT